MSKPSIRRGRLQRAHNNVIWMRSDYCPGCRASVWGKKVQRIADGQYHGGANAWVEWRCECGWQGRMFAQDLGRLYNTVRAMAAAIRGEHVEPRLKQRLKDAETRAGEVDRIGAGIDGIDNVGKEE